jgi:hypothetical protein
MVNLVKSPDATIIHPISNCLDVCLNTDSYLLSAASAAQFRAEFDLSPIPIGEVFVFFGQTFTVGTVNNHNTFIWSSTDASQTAANLLTAFSRNALLSEMYNFNYISSGATITELLVIWKEMGFNSDFTFSGDMPNWLLRSSGTNAIYQEGYEYIWELWGRTPTGVTFPILPVESCTPLITANGDTSDLCIEFKYDIRQLLKTTFFWTNTTIAFDHTCYGSYRVKYGSQQTKAQGCGVDFLDVNYTPYFNVCNAICQPYDLPSFAGQFLGGVDGRLWDYDHTKTTLAKFFTSRPRDNKGVITICKDEFINLWFYLPLDTPFYIVIIEVFNAAGVAIGSQTFNPINSVNERFMVIPASPMNLPSMNVLAKQYRITVQSDGIPVSETLRFRIDDCVCESEQVFFVGDKLGYETMKFTRVESVSINVNQSEICLDVPCGGTLRDRVTNGFSNVGTEAYETITLVSDELAFNENNLNWFMQFKKSESRYILRNMSDGTQQPFSLVLESGSVQIYQYQDTVQLTVTGRYGFSLDTQPQG